MAGMARAWFFRLLGESANTHRFPNDGGKLPMVACVPFVCFAGWVLPARNVLITRAVVFERCPGSFRGWMRAADLFETKRRNHRWSKGSKSPRVSL